jgi:glycosyltransferase involved in cell wall biosynthesis
MDIAIRKYHQRQALTVLPSIQNAIVDGLFVVIPAYNEKDTLPTCIESLILADLPDNGVNVVVVVNHADNDLPEVKEASSELADWCQQKALEVNSDRFRLITVCAFDIDAKIKGAGVARKIGMDQALAFCVHQQLDDGIIVSLDADTTVDRNYFTAIKRFFANPSNVACSVRFEHAFDEGFKAYAIALYELHLRYYRLALQAAGFPMAIHTVGSALACRVSAYAKAGGMVQKQAGEDFYFLHKIIKQGGFGELNETTVHPSNRASTRVVFGTGATINKMEQEGVLAYQTYNMQAFIDLQMLFANVELFYKVSEDGYNEAIIKLPGRVRSFLVNHAFYQLISPVGLHCASLKSFQKRFFEVFNAFMVIKYLNFTHEHFLAKPDVCEAASMFLEINGLLDDPFADVFGLLNEYRRIDNSQAVISLVS